ncbi:hypothetical protein Tcan_11957, partial [Toxocara canis]
LDATGSRQTPNHSKQEQANTKATKVGYYFSAVAQLGNTPVMFFPSLAQLLNISASYPFQVKFYGQPFLDEVTRVMIFGTTKTATVVKRSNAFDELRVVKTPKIYS